MRRLFAIFLLLTILLSFFGCSSENTVTEASSTEASLTDESIPETEAPTVSPTTEPAFDLSTWQGNYDLGVFHMDNKEWPEAYAAFDAAIALDPNHADAYAQRGNARILSGETEEVLTLSREDYQQALALDESNALAYLGIVDVHIRRAEYDEAVDAMADAAKKTGSDPLLDKMRDRLERGIYMDSAQNYRRTTKSYYGSNNAYIGHIVVEYENGVAASAESFGPSGKSTGFIELSEATNGNVTDKVWYHIDLGKEVTVLKYVTRDTVHDDGTSEHETEMFGRNGKRTAAGHSYYDAEGRTVRHESYDGDGNMQFYSTNEYDSEALTSRTNNYMPDGTLREYTISYFDSEGTLIKGETFYGNGEMNCYWLYQYTEAGNLKSQECYSPSGELISSTVYE